MLLLLNNSGNPSKLSREDLIMDDGGFITIVGGKLTTYRCMAKKAVTKIDNHLPARPNKMQEKLNITYFPKEKLKF